MGEKKKGMCRHFYVPGPAALAALVEYRYEAKIAREMNRYGKSANKVKIGQIA